MSQNDQRNVTPKKGEGGQKRPHQKRRKRRPQQNAANRNKQPQQTNKPREERPDRTQRVQRKERSQRKRRPRRDIAPAPATYEDVLRDNARIEKEIQLDIDGFSQITLDL